MVGLCCFLPSKSTSDRFPATAAVLRPPPRRSKSEVPGNRYFVPSPARYPVTLVTRYGHSPVPSEYPTCVARRSTLLVGHAFFHSAGGSPAAGHFSCAAKKSNQKKAAPGVAPLFRGGPVLPDSTRRLRNSTWQGTHNVPCHGTRTVLADIFLSNRAARRVSRGGKAP